MPISCVIWITQDKYLEKIPVFDTAHSNKMQYSKGEWRHHSLIQIKM